MAGKKKISPPKRLPRHQKLAVKHESNKSRRPQINKGKNIGCQKKRLSGLNKSQHATNNVDIYYSDGEDDLQQNYLNPFDPPLDAHLQTEPKLICSTFSVDALNRRCQASGYSSDEEDEKSDINPHLESGDCHRFITDGEASTEAEDPESDEEGSQSFKADVASQQMGYETKTTKNNRLRRNDSPPSDDDDTMESMARNLTGLRKRDPSFYRYIMATDASLLNDSVDPGDSRLEVGNRALDKEALPTTTTSTLTPIAAKELTLERFEALFSNTQKSHSMHSLRLLVASFRTAIRTASTMLRTQTGPATSGTSKDEIRQDLQKQSGIANGRRNIISRQKTPSSPVNAKLPFHLDFDADHQNGYKLLKRIVLGVIDLLPVVLEQSRYCPRPSGHPSFPAVAPTPSIIMRCTPIPGVSKPLRWMLRDILHNFWSEVTSLLVDFCSVKIRNCLELSFAQEVLLSLSQPMLLRFLFAAKPKIRKAFIVALCNLWLEAPWSLEMGLSSFVVIRNMCAIFGLPRFHAAVIRASQLHKGVPDESFSKMAHRCQQELISRCYRGYLTLISKIGFSWKFAPGYQLMINCFSELLGSCHSTVGNRVFSLVVNQLHNAVRQVLNPQVPSITKTLRKNSKAAEDATASRENQTPTTNAKSQTTVVSRPGFQWTFVLASRLAVTCIANHTDLLRPLTFPLSCIFCGAIRSKLTSPEYRPFVLHCLKLQCDLMAVAEAFVPLGSHLFAFGKEIIQQQNKAFRQPIEKQNGKSRQHTGGSAITSLGAVIPKSADVDLAIRLSTRQRSIPMVIDLIVDRWITLCIDYLGLLGRHPAFPEVCVPLIMQIKELENCRAKGTRSALKKLGELCRISATEIKSKRFAMNPLVDAPNGKLFIFSGDDISICQYRQSKLAENSSRLALQIKCSSSAPNVIEESSAVEPTELSNIESQSS